MTVTEYNLSVDEYADRLFRFIIKSVKDRDMANDIVQETYTKLWEKVATVNYEKVRSYLFTSSYHIMLNSLRKNNKLMFMDDLRSNEKSYHEPNSDLKEVLDKALDQIPEIQKTVILLRDYEGYSYQDIAEITDLNESQVKVYIYRGRMALKEIIGSIDSLV